MIYEIVELSSEIAKQKEDRITFSTECDDFHVSFDNNRLQQVMINLLSNAIEASPVGEEVIIRLVEHDKEVTVEVIDNGPGIPTEHAFNIYDPFFSTKEAGTGLGLSIVKKIVEAHGGSIRLEDTQKNGTTFRIIIPK